MDQEKARIGVTGPDRGGFIAWVMTAIAIRRSGATPVRITPSRRIDATELDGLVIGGGSDVHPRHYGEDSASRDEDGLEREHNTMTDWLIGIILTFVRFLFARFTYQDYDPERDELEKHLIQHALYFDLPTLGICRGAQLMNVVLGGSLHQNIEHFYTEDASNVRSILPRKRIGITPESRLREVLGRSRCQVNALHDQSIRDLGDELRVSAVEHNGVVQAIERSGHPFFLGVQWHPEFLPQSKVQQKLFRSLVNNSENRPAGADR